ncbi:saccharopine dehydrogenase (NAD+, L-lysine forming) [Cohaesibacter sp. ES.047]|uniref:saccharopine dehydrogenase n=1 Tax=Cohaesibacter sp. ES.047 TaxID=1798205 RepID=UPI000BB82F26|nr:saccharopine dehydrogenase [Cohaesibacter sp. ES.047]SNY90549.1 saccharopine dehydrogenase (NAD+, L-lysine forming) [Cohaesibacter sp. ES.047]
MSTQKAHIWLRDEDRSTERRTALTPKNARILIEQGFDLTVERSDKRAFPDKDYEKVGCTLADPRSWVDAPSDTVVLGLKELAETPSELPHRMIHFAHIYKDQTGWEKEMARFVNGGGLLYDIEFLVGEDGRRVAAFGYWAGWMGAALGVHRLLERRAGKNIITNGVSPFESQSDIIDKLKALADEVDGPMPNAIVVGAKGRSGTGASECLEAVGLPVTKWDMEETRILNRTALLSHDLLVNCVLMTGPGLLLANQTHLSAPQSRMKVISDVSCDPFSDFNPLPLYKAPTSWTDPVIKVGKNSEGDDVEVTSIDNLPSLLPAQAAEEFSDQFLAPLMRFPDGVEWKNAELKFHEIRQKAGL